MALQVRGRRVSSAHIFWCPLIGGLAILFLAAARPTGKSAALIRAEGDRITRALGSAPARSSEVAPAPRGGDPCGARGTRLIKVSTAPQLAAALAEARPGDHIRMADGVYRGRFALERSGTEERPISLCGSRAAVLDAQSDEVGYGLHLRGVRHWRLTGFTVRGARKGIMADGATHNVLRGLEVYGIGEEGVHLRAGSSDNIIRGCWIHDVGLDTPFFGEAIYLGSARSNWNRYTHGRPDASDRNQVVANVLGPGVRAEGVDAKEGTRGGLIADNLFLGTGATAADSWIDLKGNDYRVERNRGTFDAHQPWRGPVTILAGGRAWGRGNLVKDNAAMPAGPEPGAARRVAGGGGTTTLVLPERTLSYELPELAVRFPQTLEAVSPGTWMLHEPILAGPGSRLVLRRSDVQELRLRSTDGGFASIVGMSNEIAFEGSGEGRVTIRSWDPERKAPDHDMKSGRAYVCSIAGRMDLDLAEFTDLGFGTGWTSGVAWRGRPPAKGHGDVRRSRFERNYFGAYTFECDSMRWTDNVFANNAVYGFDPHDNSDWFVVTGNEAYGNPRHGIIFSRGCRGNVLRRNRSHSNGGHGIMMDDGKVAKDGDPRHRESVPPIGNVIEENEVWGNEAGIVLQGCVEHVVRANQVRQNRFGIRLDQSDRNELADNQVVRSREFGIHLFSGSDENRVHGNHVQGGVGGIVTLDSRANVIEGNSLREIQGQGIRVTGQSAGTLVAGNGVAGRGSRAINVPQSPRGAALVTHANKTGSWLAPRPRFPAILLWSAILGIPALTTLLGMGRGLGRRRAAGLVPPPAPGVRRRVATASFGAGHPIEAEPVVVTLGEPTEAGTMLVGGGAGTEDSE